MSHHKKNEILKVVELFAGVGGFRLGLEGYQRNRKKHQRSFETIWFNQWEPLTNIQHAHNTYVKRFNDFDESTNKDIAKVINKVPDHDLLVGGFPCQDYSVARALGDAHGLVGKKGVLWWSIYEILKSKGNKSPNYLMFENVDRLLNSPAIQRGRDFAIMISTLNMLGYLVEWRVINAADYGEPQRRRRIFILGYKKNTPIYNAFEKYLDPMKWLTETGVIQSEFPVILDGNYESIQKTFEGQIPKRLHVFNISGDPEDVSNNFNTENPTNSLFLNAGVAFNGKVFSLKTIPSHSTRKKRKTLGDIVLPDSKIPDEFYLDDAALDKWKRLKGAKREQRTSRNGHRFFYSEGALQFPDPIDKPSRTIVTGEGGSGPSRFKHVIRTESGRLRRLVPEELEMLSGFPPGHTDIDGVSANKRAFFMGNALVVGVVDKLGKALIESHNKMK